MFQINLDLEISIFFYIWTSVIFQTKLWKSNYYLRQVSQTLPCAFPVQWRKHVYFSKQQLCQ